MPTRPAVTQTALGPIFIVAVEQWTPLKERIVEDPLARRFLPRYGQLAVAAMRWGVLRRRLVSSSERRYPGLWGALLCRKRYGDEQFVRALEAGVDQVVVLGAGLDTRAYRFLVPGRQPRTFELDLPANCDDKRRKLLGAFGEVPSHVTLAAVDFETADPEHSLLQYGFDPSAPALFVWEAVTQYLSDSGVRRTLGFLSKMAAGSWLLFTYVRQDFLDGTNIWGCQALRERFVNQHAMWHFGLQPGQVAPLLAEFGWTEREQVGRAEYRARYVEPLGRRLSVTEVERFVLAGKT